MSEQYPGGFISKAPPTPDGSTAQGFWTLSQQAAYQKQGLWPQVPLPDAQFNYVTMLLHGDGTNGAQNNTFLDSSSNAFSITRNGNTTQGTFSPYGSLWSNYIYGGSSNYLSVAANAAFSFGSGDFTIEVWINPNSAGQTSCIFDTKGANYYTARPMLYQYNQQVKLFWYSGGGNVVSTDYVIEAGKWQHIAVTRSGGVVRMFYNGVLQQTATNTADLDSSTVTIGACIDGNDFPYAGYLSNLRVVKGTALYTSNFTPSTTPLTAVSGTSLLTCQSNRFIDNSSNNFALTVNGTPSVQRFNPFGASTAYSTSVIGGSGYFDGSGDYLTATNSGFNQDSDFTFECWVYPRQIASTKFLLANARTNYAKLGIDGGTGYPYVDVAGVGVLMTSNTAVKTNQWNHVAMVRSGTTAYLYLNGVQVASASKSTWVSPSGTLYLCAGDGAGENFYGYVSDMRFLYGTALYTGSTYTVPTAPLTAITNTSFLCSYTNGAIFDNAMMNDLETVGNAQISTSVYKYGTGSMYFDETGDYITVPPSSNMALGSGDFTIECWVRFAANPVGNGQGLYQLTNGYLNNTVRGPACGVENSTGGWTIYYGTTYTVSATVPTTGVWYHTAFVRSSGTSKLYINGTSIISVADTTNYTDQYFTIGGWYDVAFLLNGYIDDLRITKGYARYTSTFTPPTAAFPNIGPTV